MKHLYLDLNMGAAGDMLTAALLELLPDPAAFVEKLNALGLPGVTFTAEAAEKCGITGTHMKVEVNGEEEDEPHHDHEHHHDHDHDHEHHHHDHDHDHEHHHHDHDHEHHHHSSLHHIQHIVSHLPVSDKVKGDVAAVYTLIAEAESHVHGKPVSEIHFHEVGTLDAVADVTAVCLLMEALAPDKVTASPVHVGCGQVQCAHGILPVPAPATAYILQGIPTYGGEIRGELCTPTGAALLKHFVSEFGPQPVMAVSNLGYGCGKKDFPAANCVRAILGESGEKTDRVCELSCNVDDMTAERIGFALEQLLAAGAKEVYTLPIGMKKSRPGTLIRVLCDPADRERMVGLLFTHTTTIGVRQAALDRYVLDRHTETADTPFGPVRRKVCTGWGVTRVKYEYEDLARIAREQGISLADVEAALPQ